MADITGGVSAGEVQALIEQMMPAPATLPPPPVAVNSTAGTAGASAGYARADHTHQSRLQARRVQLTFDANGEAAYTFPLPYDVGVIPIVSTTVENTRGASYRYDATVKQDATTNTSATIVLTKTPRTLTVTLLGAVINVFTNPADTVWVNIMSRAPS